MYPVIMMYSSFRDRYAFSKSSRNSNYCVFFAAYQGSFSGPLLFLIFISDLLSELEQIPSLHFVAFADDI
ncbi:unnamed protein product [Caenorhabditis nigoni]